MKLEEAIGRLKRMITVSSIMKLENLINSDADMEYIKNVGIKMIITSLVITSVTIIASYLSARISMGYGKVLRQKIFEKVSTFSQGDINKLLTDNIES